MTASPAMTAPPLASASPSPEFDVVTTQMVFNTPPARTWEQLMFYEQIDAPPPFYLRMLLPVPIRTEGRKSQVGDQALCIYKEGHLIKRVTQVEPGRLYAFEVIEQDLAVGNGMRLSNGSYTMREISGGRTEVSLLTRYSSPKRPRWLWAPVEAAVCHLFHRHILSAIRRSLRAE